MNLSLVSKASLVLYIALALNISKVCSTQSSQANEPDHKVFTRDATDPNKINDLDTSKYKAEKKTNETTLTFDNDYKPVSVKVGDKEVWKHDSSKNDGKKPKSLTYNEERTKVVLVFDGLQITCEKDSDGNWSSTEQAKQTQGKKENEQAKKTPNPDQNESENQEGKKSTDGSGTSQGTKEKKKAAE